MTNKLALKYGQREFLASVRAATTTLLKAAQQYGSPGTEDTPRRVAEAWWEMLEGDRESPREILGTVFESGEYDQMILVTNIDFWSTCEHHLLPFQGTAHVGYLPGWSSSDRDKTRVVGLSKIPRLVRCFARRLQLQERMVSDVAESMMTHETLRPRGVAVIANATHSCMACRGVRSRGTMTTSVMLGEFRKSDALRQELLTLIALEHER